MSCDLKMKTVTAAIVFDKNGNVLITRRKKGEKNEGFWEFPGGKLKENETLEKCLQRELLEELGVDSKTGDKAAESIYKYDHGKIKLVAFISELDSTEFNLTAHDKYDWVNPKLLLNFNLTPADIPIAEKIINGEIKY